MKKVHYTIACFALVTGFVVQSLWGAPAQTAAPKPDSTAVPSVPSRVQAWAFRLKPGQDLLKELHAFVKAHDLKAVCVLTCVGSLTDTAIRYANKEETTRMKGHFEIVSLVGTLEPGGGHLHLSVSDGKGRTTGGHLKEGNRIYTTAEIVLAELPDVRFAREKDNTFGYNELTVYPR